MSHADDEQRVGEPHTQNRKPSSGGQFINSLPPEIFVKIIAEVDLLSRRLNGLKRDINWIVPYQLVCRHWKDVISSTPQFWQEVTIRSSPKWLELCLTRCASAPATIVLWHPAWPDATFATLRRFSSSIGAIYVHSDDPDTASLTGLCSFLATSMPALESLSLEGVFDDKAFVDVEISRALVPRLAALHLRNCTAPSDTEVYRSLRSFLISRSVWTLSYGQFLETIGRCHAVEHLTLDEDILDLFADQIEYLTTDYLALILPVVLPRLKFVMLSGKCDVLFHLLANLHAPQARSFELTNRLDDDESGPLVTRLIAPDPHLRIPFLSSPHTLSLSCWDGAPFKLRLQCGPEGHALFSVNYGMVHNEFWPGNANLQPNLAAVMDIFPVASVDTLEVKGNLGAVTVETWQRVFQTFSSLRTLRPKGWGTLDALWLGLSRATTSSLKYGGAMCCPSLSEIGMEDTHHDFPSGLFFPAALTLFDVVRGTLRARADRGARLKKLEMHLRFTFELWRGTSGLLLVAISSRPRRLRALKRRTWGCSIVLAFPCFFNRVFNT